MNDYTSKIIKRTALISIGINFFLFLLKLIFAYISNVKLLYFDAIHSFIDMSAPLMIYASQKINKVKSKKKPLIFEIEGIVTLIISLIIIFGAYKIFISAINPLPLRPIETVKDYPKFSLAIIATIISIFVLYIISKYKNTIGKKINSLSLIADARDSKMDMFSSILILFSLIGSLMGIFLNKLAGAVIAIFVAWSGIEILIISIKLISRKKISSNKLSKSSKKENNNFLQKIFLNENLTEIKKLIDELRSKFKYIILILLIIYSISGIYVVKSDEEGIIERFGVITAKEIQPGIHYSLPWPIDEIKILQITQIKKMEIGFRSSNFAEDDIWENTHDNSNYQKVLSESLMLTGDENIVDINLIVLYRIINGTNYLFKIEDPEIISRNIILSVTKEIIGGEKIDDVLTTGRLEIQNKIIAKSQEIIDSYEIGIKITGIQFNNVHPPLEVVQAFKDVSSAKEDKNRLIEAGIAYQNEVIPKARGMAEKILKDAEAYKETKIYLAEGEINKLQSIYSIYRKNKEITKQKLFIETIKEIFPNIEKYIIDEDLSLNNLASIKLIEADN